MSANLTVKRGDTYTNTLTVLDINDLAYDLTGATVWFTVKRRNDAASNDDDALVKLYWVSGGASDGITITDPDSGIMEVEISATDTAALDPTLYAYDVQIAKAGDVYTPVIGTISVQRDITIRVTTP